MDTATVQKRKQLNKNNENHDPLSLSDQPEYEAPSCGDSLS